MKQPQAEPPRWPPPWWRRVHPPVLVGLVLIFLVGPAMNVLALVVSNVLLMYVGLGVVGVGLFLILNSLMPGRNMQGTKTWQNDGTPGGL